MQRPIDRLSSLFVCRPVYEQCHCHKRHVAELGAYCTGKTQVNVLLFPVITAEVCVCVCVCD